MMWCQRHLCLWQCDTTDSTSRDCACHLLLLQASAVLFPKRLFLGPSTLTSASLWLSKVLSQSHFRPIRVISSPYVCTKNSYNTKG